MWTTLNFKGRSKIKIMTRDICKRTLYIEFEPFRHFAYVTVHSPTLPLLHLRHSTFSNPYFASPTSQALHLLHLASRPWKQHSRHNEKKALVRTLHILIFVSLENIWNTSQMKNSLTYTFLWCLFSSKIMKTYGDFTCCFRRC